MSCHQLTQGGTHLLAQNRRCLQQEEASSTHSLNHPPISHSLPLSLESKNKDELEREDGGKEEKEKREKWKKQARLAPGQAHDHLHLSQSKVSSRALSLHFLEINPQTLTNDSSSCMNGV